MKQVFTIYINHSRPLIPDGIHLISTRFERREKSDLSLHAEREARKPLVHAPFLKRLWYDAVKDRTHDLLLMGERSKH